MKAAGSPGPYFALNTTLLCLENTHNFARRCRHESDPNGRSWSNAARSRGLKIRLDAPVSGMPLLHSMFRPPN